MEEEDDVSRIRSRKRKASPTDDISPEKESKALKILDKSSEQFDNEQSGKEDILKESELVQDFSLSSVHKDQPHERISSEPKRQRKRTKFLIQAVLDQMEFYFSDSNLSKDRFLKQLLNKNKEGYIDLSVFGNFNKLQQLHKDGVSLTILRKALKRSEILKLSDDGNQVCRLSPFKKISKEETDRRTIYVENLPSKATHAWVQTVFSQCGKVVYVSLPKYKTTKDIKGFAFVEFNTAEEANKACLMNNPPPEKGQDRIGKFPKYNKTLSRLQRLVPADFDQNENEDEIVSDDPKSNMTSEQVKKKKKKKGKKKKISDSASEEKIGASTEHEILDVKKKKKKKKKKRTNSNSMDEETIESFNEDDSRVSEKDDSLNENDSIASLKNEKVYDKFHIDESANNDNDHIVIKPDIEVKNTEKDQSFENIENNSLIEEGKQIYQGEKSLKESGDESKTEGDLTNQRKKKRKKKKKGDSKLEFEENKNETEQQPEKENIEIDVTLEDQSEKLLSRKERKRLRQEDIRRKKREREGKTEEEKDSNLIVNSEEKDCLSSFSRSSQCTDSEAVKQDGSQVTSILKSKRQSGNKKVEFDPVPVTKEYVKVKDVRRRKRLKKEKVHLRIISKKEWDNLRAEYIKQQKSHMTALKESLRELKQQECQNKADEKKNEPVSRHVDLEDVFGTKRLKPSHDVKLAHVEALQFTPNVIVQWKMAHEMHRDKIRTLVNTLGTGLSDSIAYIDSEEEAKTGYIRFKDEKSAELFTRTSRNSDFISARLLPADQQQAYWDKANQDRMKRLGRKKKEKGSERIARKVFERNKETFLKKPNRIVFNDDNEDNSIEERIKTDFSDETESGSGNNDSSVNSKLIC